jgi:hypothetical protein
LLELLWRIDIKEVRRQVEEHGETSSLVVIFLSPLIGAMVAIFLHDENGYLPYLLSCP